ncbi:formate/nitrite transporter family protein [Streptomyces sp. 378]|nr:formate/nitrite transporter family protein [Streptomyces sp. 378]MDK1348958.1 formate/nitrite transporter family protein [Streptomyces sp. 378]
MAQPPEPREIYHRAKEEGERRLAMPALEKSSTGFIAGITIVFGIVALAMAEELARPLLGPSLAHLVGALAFGIGVVFVVVGRSELFTENFFGPVAAAIDRHQRSVWNWASCGPSYWCSTLSAEPSWPRSSQ